ncbi:MAG: MerR family transcriptional regulator [Thermodesulfobacteriota bacterium]
MTDARKAPAETQAMAIPDKQYFRMGEVASLTGVAAHVLRYWESEFAVIRPNRVASKQRLYRRADVENFLRIKELLYEEGYTIPGARKALAQARKGGRSQRSDILAAIKGELVAICRLLEEER